MEAPDEEMIIEALEMDTGHLSTDLK